ncbi:MAG: GAF domain-containing protein [Pseudomonadota bacterium]
MDLPDRNTRVSGLHIVILLVMASVASLLAWTTWSARDLVRTFAPQIDASASSRLTVTEAHLWLEEIVSGDDSESPQQVWDLIAESRAALTALGSGGKDAFVAVRQVDDEQTQAHVSASLVVLDQFEQIARERVGGSDAGVGTDIDSRFDDVFEEFVASTDQVDRSLNASIDRKLVTFTLVQGVLIAVVIALFLWVLYLLRRKEAMEQDAHMSSMRESYARLEQSQHELERQNRLRGMLVELGEQLQGQDSPALIARIALDMLCERTGAQAGACWGYRPGNGLHRLAGRAIPEERAGLAGLEEGEGLVGRVALDQVPLVLDTPSDYFRISSGLGNAPARYLHVMPLVHDGATVAVIELAFLEAPDADAAALLEAAAPAIAVRLYLVGRFDDVDEALRAAVM